MIDKNTPSPGFCGMTFDEWMESLTDEESDYLYRHVMFGGITPENEALFVWTDPNGKIASCGLGKSTRAFQFNVMGLKDRILTVLTDKESEFVEMVTKSLPTIKSDED